MYEIEGYTILHSGRPVPGDTDTVERNERVGIVLYVSMPSRDMEKDWRGIKRS